MTWPLAVVIVSIMVCLTFVLTVVLITTILSEK